MVKIIITSKEKNLELKKFVQDKFELSSSKVGKMIDSGDVKVNNQKSFFKYLLKEKDEIKIFSIKSKKENYYFLQTKYKLNIFYEDENIIIINKTRGILCQEDKNEKLETLNNALKKYLYENKKWNPNESNDFIPNLCHRLDKYTPGLIIAAKNRDSLIEINESIKENKLTKIYCCLVYGIVNKKEATLENYIMKNEEKNIMEIDKENKYNKKITTKYKVIEEYKNYSKLRVQILTGRKHQIRVHLASINHPLLGDTKYNKINTLGYKFPCLVSQEIKFNFNKNSNLYYLNKKTFKLDNIKFV